MEKSKIRDITFHEEMIPQVVEKLDKLWGEGGKSKSFVIHLIGAFYRGNATHFSKDLRRFDSNKCCLTGLRLTSTYDAVKIAKSNIDEMAISYLRCTRPQEMSKFDSFCDRVHLAVESHRSDKLLSEIAYQALLRWVSVDKLSEIKKDDE